MHVYADDMASRVSVHGRLELMSQKTELRSLAWKSGSEAESFERRLRGLEDADEWSQWKREQARLYASSTEELERYVIWRSNKAYIESHNEYSQEFGYTVRMNKFGDLSSDEYAQFTKCVKTIARQPSTPNNQTGPETEELIPQDLGLDVTYFNAELEMRVRGWKDLPDTVDWRSKGVITPVKDQERCRSCYAFAVTGALEGLHALSTGNLTSLSEQNILDCSVPYGNRGCSGGSRSQAILYIVDRGGVDREKTYPYIARSLCRFRDSDVGSSCTGMVRIPRADEQALKAAVAIAGPVTVAVDSRHSGFQFYGGGIYSQPSCSSTHLTHSMLVVGYGTTHGKDYWLVKNSWGPNWGMDGYIMMTRNSYNQCGIATCALYPK